MELKLLYSGNGHILPATKVFASWPAAVKEWVKENGYKEFQGTLNCQDYTYFLVAMGPVPSSGFLVNIDELVETNNQLTIYISIKKPHPASRPRRVISYPLSIAFREKINHDVVIFKKRIHVSN